MRIILFLLLFTSSVYAQTSISDRQKDIKELANNPKVPAYVFIKNKDNIVNINLYTFVNYLQKKIEELEGRIKVLENN